MEEPKIIVIDKQSFDLLENIRKQSSQLASHFETVVKTIMNCNGIKDHTKYTLSKDFKTLERIPDKKKETNKKKDKK